jgi:SAM-dependent methyltransferase
MIQPRERWQKPDSGTRYEGRRWRSVRRRGNDPRLVGRILARYLEPRGGATVLDAPCGTGRLRPAIAGPGRRWIGLDVSASMLAALDDEALPRVRGDVAALPFADDAFAAVVCCRLLHHLQEPEGFRRTVTELVRVSRELVVASFWDAGSLPARHRRVFPHRGGRRVGRIPHAKAHVRLVFAGAGAEVLGFHHTLRFFSRQTFVVARPLPGGTHG